MTTTLNKIREHNPCKEGWEKLLSALGKTKADDEELSLLTILDSNGFDDAVWCFRAVDGYDFEIRAFARFCAMQNIEKIKPYTSEENYNLIIKWLKTGDESIMSAAESAEWSVQEIELRRILTSKGEQMTTTDKLKKLHDVMNLDELSHEIDEYDLKDTFKNVIDRIYSDVFAEEIAYLEEIDRREQKREDDIFEAQNA